MDKEKSEGQLKERKDKAFEAYYQPEAFGAKETRVSKRGRTILQCYIPSIESEINKSFNVDYFLSEMITCGLFKAK